MTVDLQPGSRLRSVTCTTEVVVVRGADGVDLRCGGAPMVTIDDTTDPVPAVAPFDQGTLAGKRYATDDLELLCSKPGEGSLSIGDVALEVKGAKPLPSSD